MKETKGTGEGFKEFVKKDDAAKQKLLAAQKMQKQQQNQQKERLILASIQGKVSLFLRQNYPDKNTEFRKYLDSFLRTRNTNALASLISLVAYNIQKTK